MEELRAEQRRNSLWSLAYVSQYATLVVTIFQESWSSVWRVPLVEVSLLRLGRSPRQVGYCGEGFSVLPGLPAGRHTLDHVRRGKKGVAGRSGRNFQHRVITGTACVDIVATGSTRRELPGKDPGISVVPEEEYLPNDGDCKEGIEHGLGGLNRLSEISAPLLLELLRQSLVLFHLTSLLFPPLEFVTTVPEHSS
ncbi:hypothetical protein Q3G72_024617 [Acer saccharum]|nr:hypothetical protein Q3G72_024617 [Acer saccharum]